MQLSSAYPGPNGELEESLKNCVRYIISKTDVESCDVTNLIHDLRPSLDNPLFAAGPGKIIFEINGYGINPRHLALVPEVRGFLQKAEEYHPCWLYFAWPYSDWPNLVALACSEQLTIRNSDYRTLQFGVDRDTLGAFLRSQVESLEYHSIAIGISAESVATHLDALFERWFPDYLAD